MIRLVNRATLLSALCLMAASAVLAGVPNSNNSTKPTCVILVSQESPGGAGALPIPGLGNVAVHTYTIRDGANNAVNNSVVTINMSVCVPGGGTEIKLSDPQTFAGVSRNCAAKTVSVTTNASGVAVFRLLGRVLTNPGPGSGVASQCAVVTADGVPFGTVNVATGDLNGGGGINPADGALFLADRDTPPANTRNLARSDYNGSGLVNPADGGIYIALQDYSLVDVTAGTDCLP